MSFIIFNAVLSALAYAAGIVLPLVSGSLSPVASCSVTKTLWQTLLIAAYRILFHPLAKYPGPFPAKLTSAYTAFYAWRRCSHISAYHSFETYGRTIILEARSLSVLFLPKTDTRNREEDNIGTQLAWI